jgi:pimeloyl-ACP methyl ester carboxylesterase
MIDHYERVNGVLIHYLDREGGEPPIVMLPGLSANAHAFDGLAAAGLSPRFRTIALSLRGRGESDKPDTGYTLDDHAGDVLALLDHLGIERATILGHSFGGLLTVYLAAKYPHRVASLVLLDVAVWILEDTTKLIRVSIDRLTKTFPSADGYIDALKQAPYLDGFWDPMVERYFRAEIETSPDGTARARTSAAAIEQVIQAIGKEPWGEYVKQISAPSILINGPGAYGPPGAPAIVPAALARETAASIPGCRYVEVPGNHITMIFGDNARQVVRAIAGFVAAEVPAQ